MRNKKTKLLFLLLGVLTGMVLSYDLILFQSIDMVKAGVSLWMAFAVAAFVIILEAVPAIVFFKGFLDFQKKVAKKLDPNMDWKPIKTKLLCWAMGVAGGLILGLDVVWARSIDLSQAGAAFWIFIAIGLVIILLQLIPALIMFVSFIAYVAKLIHKQKMDEQEKKQAAEGTANPSTEEVKKE